MLSAFPALCKNSGQHLCDFLVQKKKFVCLFGCGVMYYRLDQPWGKCVQDIYYTRKEHFQKKIYTKMEYEKKKMIACKL